MPGSFAFKEWPSAFTLSLLPTTQTVCFCEVLCLCMFALPPLFLRSRFLLLLFRTVLRSRHVRRGPRL